MSGGANTQAGFGLVGGLATLLPDDYANSVENGLALAKSYGQPAPAPAPVAPTPAALSGQDTIAPQGTGILGQLANFARTPTGKIVAGIAVALLVWKLVKKRRG